MKNSLARLSALAAISLLAVSCLGDPTGPSTVRTGALALAPEYAHAMASAIVDVSKVRVQLRRPGTSPTVLDTVLGFPAGSDTLRLVVDVPLVQATEQFELMLAMTNAAGDTVFRAGPILITASSRPGAQTPTSPVFTYVGVGADASGVRFLTPPSVVGFGQTVTLRAEAFDGQGVTIAGAPVGFELVNQADTVRARILDARTGVFVAGTLAGNVQVRAVLASGQSVTHTIAVQAPGGVNAWINAASGDWSNAANWSLGRIPSATDTATIRAAGTYTVTVDQLATVGRVELGAATGVQTLLVPSAALTVMDTIVSTAAGIVHIDGGTVTGPGGMRLAGAFHWSDGVLDLAGATRVEPTGSLLIDGVGTKAFTRGVIELSGTGNWSDTHQLTASDGVVLHVTPGATLNIIGDPTVFHFGDAPMTFINEGTVTRGVSTGVASLTTRFMNTGTLTVSTGTLALRDGGSLDGTVTAAAGATLGFTGGIFALPSRFALTGAGTALIDGASVNNAPGDSAFFGRLRLSSGQLATRGVVRVSTELLWDGSAEISSGVTHVDTNATMLLSGTADRAFYNAVLEHEGLATWSGDFTLHTGVGAVLRTLPGGTFDWTSNGSMLNTIGAPLATFDNQGDFNRWGSGVATLGAVLVDTIGSGFRIQSGDLHLLNGGRMGGSPYTGGTLAVMGGTLSQQDGISWSSDGGLLRIDGGTITVDSGGTASISELDLVSGAIAHEGRMDVWVTFNWSGGTISSNTVGLGGVTEVPANAWLDISGAAAKSLRGTHTLSNFGTVVFGGTGDLNTGEGARIENNFNFEFQGAGRALFSLGGAAPVFFNADTAVIDVTGSSPGVIGMALDNPGGTLRATGDTLRLSGGFVNNFQGNAVSAPGMAVTLGGGTFMLTGPLGSTGDLAVSAGILDLGSSTATVTGNFTVAGSGALRSTSSASTLLVSGDATFGGAPGVLSGGRLDVGGDFLQQGATSFVATGTHVTRFTGAAAQSITFAQPGVASNRFNLVDIINTAPTADVVLGSDAVSSGMLRVLQGRLGKVAPHRFIVGGDVNVGVGAGQALRPFVLEVAGAFATGIGGITPDTLVLNNPGTYTWANIPSGVVHQRFNAGTVTFTPTNAPADLIVSGTGLLQVPGPNKAVFGSLVTTGGGRLEMLANADLDVTGNASFGGGSTSGLLTQGILRVSGAFAQVAGGSAQAYAPSGAHRVELRGSGNQSVRFDAPATSRFQRLQVNAGTLSPRTVTLLSDVTVADSLVMLGGAQQTVLNGAGTAQRLTVGGFVRMTQQTASPRLAPPVLLMSLRPSLDSMFAAGTGIAADTVVYTGSALTSLPLGRPIRYNSLRLSTTNVLPMTSANSFADSVRGNLEITSGGLSVNSIGFGAVVTGDLVTLGTGVLQMQTGFQVLQVNGNARFNGGSTVGRLTNGVLRVLGNFEQGGPNGDSFQASAAHAVEFGGSAIQNVTFTSPDTIAGASRFAAMNLYRQGARSRVNLLSDVHALVVSDTSAGFADSLITAGGARLIAGRASLSNTVITRAPLVLTSGNGLLELNVVRFQNMDPTTNYLTFTRNEGFGGATFNSVDFGLTVPTTGLYIDFIQNGAIQSAVANFTNSLPGVLGSQYRKTVINGGSGLALPMLTWNGNTLP